MKAATRKLLEDAKTLGENAADAYWDEFGCSPLDGGAVEVGDWDSSAWQTHWHELRDDGATDADYGRCHDAWKEGFWGDIEKIEE